MALQRGPALVRSTLEVDDLMLFVSQVHPLKLLSAPVRRSLCEQACLVRFNVGERVCTQGDFADAFYVILTGSIQVFREPDKSSQPSAEQAEAAEQAAASAAARRTPTSPLPPRATPTLRCSRAATACARPR